MTTINTHHQVAITPKPFLISAHLVTNEQYANFVAACNVKEPKYWQDPRFNQPQQPVVGINWHEALAYCEWVNGRLPTDEQWLSALGDIPDDVLPYAWCHENSENQTQPVGTRLPNEHGIYDMLGNVCEWLANSKGPERVIRGGGWLNSARSVRSASRYWVGSGYRDNDLGFRVAFD